MIEMTKKAIDYVENIMKRTEGAIGFRLSVKETSCSGLMYVPEVVKEAKAEDQCTLIGDFHLYIPQDSVKALEGLKIDLATKTLGQQQLVFNNPNADTLCGCGESFNLKKKEK